MKLKNESGLTGIDIAISILIITVFIALVGNLIINLTINSNKSEKDSIATSYAIKEIESIKSLGYISNYNDRGITSEDVYTDEDIYDENSVFTGFHKTVKIKDYILIKNDSTKIKNILKELTVEISYKYNGKSNLVTLSTYVVKK